MILPLLQWPRLVRRFLGRTYPGDQDFIARLELNFVRSKQIVRFYYLLSSFFAYSLLRPFHEMARTPQIGGFLWPVAWLKFLPAGQFYLIELIPLALLALSLAALQFPAVRPIRVGYSAVSLFAIALMSAPGAIDHVAHLWFWLGASLCLLPAGRPAAKITCAYKLSYVSAIAGSQMLMLTFYSLAGFWKICEGLEAVARGVEGNFAPRGLAEQFADRMLVTGTNPLLADFAITNYWLIWPAFIALIYIQFVAIFVAFRPRLHQTWGYALILFHTGTWLLMEIDFPMHVVFAALFLVMSPFRPTRFDLRQTLADLPGLGVAFRFTTRATGRAMQPALAGGVPTGDG